MPDDANIASSVSIRAPPFCSQDPSVWFSILECSFTSCKVTNSLTKFTHAVSLLPPDVLPQVSDVISAASTSTTPYDDLKTAVLTRLQSSITTRLQELLSKEELGDEKPSDLYRRMKQLLGDKFHSFDADIFKQLFYQRLPPAVQRCLFSIKDSLQSDAIATLADDFVATLPSPHASAVSSTAPADDSRFTALTKQIDLLTSQVASLQKQLQHRPRSCSSTPHQRHRSRSKSPAVCWYHTRFGDNAVKCTAPCTFKTLNPPGGQ